MATYQVTYPAIQFTMPLQSFLTSSMPIVASISQANSQGVRTIFTNGSLSNLQFSSLTSMMQNYTDPFDNTLYTAKSYFGVNQADPLYELDVKGQANISAGLTVQQPTGSVISFMGAPPSGSATSLSVDWSAFPFGKFGTISNPGCRWQLYDLGNGRNDVNLLLNSFSPSLSVSSLTSKLYISGSNGFIGINNTTPNYALDICGCLNSSQTLSASNLITSSASISSIYSSSISTGLLSMPNSSSFTGQYSELSKTPLLSIYTSGSPIFGAKIWLGMGITSGGSVTFWPTSNSTASGVPFFTSILHADATAWVNTSSVTNIPVFGGKSITANMSAVTFNGIVGNSVLVGGNSVAFVSNGVSVSALIIGT